MTALLDPFRNVPLAHRGLHDAKQRVVENSRSAFSAAIARGYGIELDVQLSADGQAMVFHDYDLKRLTDETGPIRQRSSTELAGISLKNSNDGIETLADICQHVAGQVPVLVEIKDQDGALGADVGPLESAVADALSSYDSPAAVMSFNPHSVAAMAELLPSVPRGLTTSSYAAEDWPLLPDARRNHLRQIAEYSGTGCSFISHQVSDLPRPRVRELKSGGAAILCWTVTSADTELTAREIADNITFEGYLPEI